ncbi:unnamed protein product, partial [Durusdinium trenchii]
PKPPAVAALCCLELCTMVTTERPSCPKCHVKLGARRGKKRQLTYRVFNLRSSIGKE